MNRGYPCAMVLAGQATERALEWGLMDPLGSSLNQA